VDMLCIGIKPLIFGQNVFSHVAKIQRISFTKIVVYTEDVYRTIHTCNFFAVFWDLEIWI
jgi:hypothetical protein